MSITLPSFSQFLDHFELFTKKQHEKWKIVSNKIPTKYDLLPGRNA